MRKKGQRSRAELSIVVPLSPAVPAPDCPYHLGTEACAVWRAVTDSLPSHYFPPEAFDTLSAYANHTVSARMLSRQIDEFAPEWLAEEGGIERFNKLLAMRERETRAAAAMARALRLTNQSRYQPSKAALVAEDRDRRRPWDPLITAPSRR
jgi:hypothetical protein